nr:integrin beta-1-like [Misgurnus anguillicaudatus]
MGVKVLLISALLAFVSLIQATTDSKECVSANAKTCGECIQIGPQCVWCKDPDFKPSRCNNKETLEKAGCTPLGIENPQGTLTIDKNKPVTFYPLFLDEMTYIQPQKLTLNLRSGEPLTFTLTFRRAEDFHFAHDVNLENSKLPDGVSISFVSHCKSGMTEKEENERKFSESEGVVKFDVEIKTEGCPSNGTSETIKIKRSGLNEEVEVVLNFICECECHKDAIPNSPECTDGNGALECGVCRCNEGRLGRLCECSREEVLTENLDAYCRKDLSANICSNNGECVCGTCECKSRENPEERYSGRYCECDNFSCDRFNNKLCGGHGVCQCGSCVCEPGYAGSACDCSLDTSTCLARNNQICNGQGICECGMCRCVNPKFQGPTCEICPTCPGV